MTLHHDHQSEQNVQLYTAYYAINDATTIYPNNSKILVPKWNLRHKTKAKSVPMSNNL